MARAPVLAVAVGLVLVAGAVGTARAADPDGYYTIQGVGIETCEIWLGERQSDGPTAWYHEQWVLGYVTAFNRWEFERSNVSLNVSNEQLFHWIDEYCHRNPQQSLSLATEALVWALRERQP